ncbi:MAG TPA: hypothetical protein VMT08_33090 [Bradyrhizobium sp.]|nr:hypothetical protein [Bradyrhizobium sp.]
MTGPDKKGREALARLADVLIEDLLAAPDEEILAEFVEERGDPVKNAEDMRALFEKSILKSNKDRLRAARAGLEADQASPATAKLINIANVRTKLKRALASCPPEVKLTLAARNESELSDADVLGMLQDLEELGIVVSDDDSGN